MFSVSGIFRFHFFRLICHTSHILPGTYNITKTENQKTKQQLLRNKTKFNLKLKNTTNRK